MLSDCEKCCHFLNAELKDTDTEVNKLVGGDLVMTIISKLQRSLIERLLIHECQD